MNRTLKDWSITNPLATTSQVETLDVENQVRPCFKRMRCVLGGAILNFWVYCLGVDRVSEFQAGFLFESALGVGWGSMRL